MHYAVPRIFAAAGILDRLYTDSVAPVSSPVPVFLAQRMRPLQRFMERIPNGVPRERIKSFQGFGLEYATRLRLARMRGDMYGTFIWGGRKFCDKVRATGLPNADAVYAYNSAALELFTFARGRGLFCALEQTIAPMALEMELLSQERAEWPGWEHDGNEPGVQLEYANREMEEWKHANVVLCGSEFVAAGIRARGGSAVNCSVVPYGVDFGNSDHAPRVKKKSPTLRVLFIGTVGLRKGIHYLCQTAGLLSPSRFEFRAVGPSNLTPSATKSARERITFTGPVSRSLVKHHYRWADVLVLPSLCEGSATVAYEALAAGVPVIATPNAGTVIRDGIEGFIVPARATALMAERLERIFSEEGLLERMSSAALSRSREFTVESYARRLLSVLDIEGCSRGPSVAVALTSPT